MKVGFTGTKEGMTAYQKSKVMILLEDLEPTEFHHGDCIGADDEADEIARSFSIPIVIHPPANSRLRAFCFRREGPTTQRWPAPYLKRNHNIVDECSSIIVCPKEMEMPITKVGGGTWATYRYCTKQPGKQISLILPREIS